MVSTLRYSVVIPMYNEEEVIQETYRRLKRVMSVAGESYELIFVNDGSQDRCAQIIREYSEWDETVRIINFSRHFGHQIAMTAGMDYASGDAIILIDADFQDPPQLIIQMITKWKEGTNVVNAQRIKRRGPFGFTKWVSSAFYRIFHASMEFSFPIDTGDFLLLDRRVCDEIQCFPEKSRHVRGLVSWIGFKQVTIEYEGDVRLASKTKYSFKKIGNLCIDRVTSFSIRPLRHARYMGLLLSGGGFLNLLYVLYLVIFANATLIGWSALISVLLIFNGFVLIMLGILGEYLSRIYEEARGRPLYIVRESYGFEDR